MILFINACVRKESRTNRLASCLLAGIEDEVIEVRTADIVFPITDEVFLDSRDLLIAKGAYDDPMFDLARQFAEADMIVIAAPYWDLSFPASLKQYIEQINVLGITFRYTEEGVPQGLCRADRLVYVTTSGGDYCPDDYGFGYIRALATGFYGIQDVRQIRATGLDIIGRDPEAILEAVSEEIKRMYR